ncbi:DUF3667 domain-containing protein [Sphingomonas sp.]|jgi:hypothetical protein|uniref:DUF3667 domain-containing protein n=1 Tax=Sphingomonas sp. TaxID=28214 RepID=UPI0035C8136E
MNGVAEGAADAAMAGLAARAAEPHAGDAYPHAAHGGQCLNCGAALIGEHCHVCGQSAHVHRSVGAIGHEIAHGVFHFEGKIWRTLPLLVFRPGELTRRYAAGERAKFVSPLAIFLFSVFLMFAIVANLPGKKFSTDFMKPGVSESLIDVRAKVVENRRREQAQLAELRQRLAREQADAEKDPERVTRLSQRIDRSSKSIADLARIEQMLPSAAATPDTEGSSGWFGAAIEHAKKNPDLVFYKLKTGAYKYSWALIPLSVPLLWLLFPFSRRFALYDHAIFVTYSLSFMSLLTIVLAVLSAVGVRPWLLISAATFIPIVHIYKQLKGAYSLGRLSALIRTFVLVNLVFWTVIPAFILGLVYLGAA